MATIKDNIITEGLSGMIGDVIVFRQVRGKTIIANRPRRPSSQSDRQRENRHRFKQASAFAKQAMQDPEKKQYYLAKARKLKLPNAYTAALTDYMRKPTVAAIKYKGNTHESIAITAGKAGFSLASVTVTMVNAKGVPLATSTATLKDRLKNEWTARLVPDQMQLLDNVGGVEKGGVGEEHEHGGEHQHGREHQHGNVVGEEHQQRRRIMVTAIDHTGNTVSHMMAA